MCDNLNQVVMADEKRYLWCSLQPLFTYCNAIQTTQEGEVRKLQVSHNAEGTTNDWIRKRTTPFQWLPKTNQHEIMIVNTLLSLVKVIQLFMSYLVICPLQYLQSTNLLKTYSTNKWNRPYLSYRHYGNNNNIIIITIINK